MNRFAAIACLGLGGFCGGMLLNALPHNGGVMMLGAATAIGLICGGFYLCRWANES